MIAEKFPGLQNMSAADKLSLVTEIWEDLEGINEKLTVPEEHQQLLDQRYAEHGDNLSPGSSWKDVKERLLSRIES